MPGDGTICTLSASAGGNSTKIELEKEEGDIFEVVGEAGWTELFLEDAEIREREAELKRFLKTRMIEITIVEGDLSINVLNIEILSKLLQPYDYHLHCGR